MTRIYSKKFWASYQGKALAIIPKCGNTSFMDVVGPNRLTNEEALLFDVRLMFLRDPLDRVVSNYSQFYALNDRDEGRTNIPREVTHNGYAHFIDYLLANENPHWAPQTKLTGGIATHVHRFNVDNIRSLWPQYFTGRQPDWLNAFTHLAVTDYRIDDLRAYYAEDLKAYEAAS